MALTRALCDESSAADHGGHQYRWSVDPSGMLVCSHAKRAVEEVVGRRLQAHTVRNARLALIACMVVEYQKALWASSAACLHERPASEAALLRTVGGGRRSVSRAAGPRRFCI